MLTEFPVIHTNIWDAIWAIPVIVVVVLVMKAFFKLSTAWLSTVATIVGLAAFHFHQSSREFVSRNFHGLFLRWCRIGVHVFGKKFLHRLSYKLIGCLRRNHESFQRAEAALDKSRNVF